MQFSTVFLVQFLEDIILYSSWFPQPFVGWTIFYTTISFPQTKRCIYLYYPGTYSDALHSLFHQIRLSIFFADCYHICTGEAQTSLFGFDRVLVGKELFSKLQNNSLTDGTLRISRYAVATKMESVLTNCIFWFHEVCSFTAWTRHTTYIVTNHQHCFCIPSTSSSQTSSFCGMPVAI